MPCNARWRRRSGSLQAKESLPAERRLEFRIGVHVGDVMVRAGDLFGDGVNIAARLQALAAPGGVCISGAVHEHVRKVLPHALRRPRAAGRQEHRRAGRASIALSTGDARPKAPRGRQAGPRP